MNLTAYRLIPRRLVSAMMFRLARIETPWLKNFIIKQYIRITKANTDFAAQKDPLKYKSLNDFFTRALAEGARPINHDNHFITSPVDGRCAEFGVLHEQTMLQAKGQQYTAAALLGSEEWAKIFENGSTATLYLAPDDYHRIHMPCRGTLEAMRFCAGDKHSVSLSLLDKIPNIFAGNERVVCLFNTPYGKMALVMVGALNVSSIQTVWHGVVKKAENDLYSYQDKNYCYQKGDEIGQFNLGSTVILLFENSVLSWKKDVLTRTEKIKMGEAIAETL